MSAKWFRITSLLLGLILTAELLSLGPKAAPAQKAMPFVQAIQIRKVAPATELPECKVTMAGFLNLRPGMSYRMVESILGCPGTEEVKSDSDSYHGAIYGWRGEGQLGANMSVHFTNNAMISKSQSGLR